MTIDFGRDVRRRGDEHDEDEVLLHGERRVRGLDEDMSAASSIGAMIQMGEAVEEGVSGQRPSPSDRHPELRGVELASEFDRRFPEFSAIDPDPGRDDEDCSIGY